MPETDRPRCQLNAWCALDPGHEDGCSIVRKRGELQALGFAVAKAFEELSHQFELFRIRIGVVLQQTQKDFTLCPDPEPECERCEGTGWIDCSATPTCGDPSHGGYCGCPVGAAREQEEGLDDGR